MADAPSLSHPYGAPESTTFVPFNIKSRDSALSLGVFQDPVSLLSIWQQERGQFLSSLQAHVLIFSCSAVGETADHSQRWGLPSPSLQPPRPSSSSSAIRQHHEARTAPQRQPHREPLFLPSPSQYRLCGQLLTVASTPGPGLTWAQTLLAPGDRSHTLLSLLPSSGAWRPRGSKKGQRHPAS